MTGHIIRLSKKEVDIKNGRVVRKRKVSFRTRIKRRVAEARAEKEAEQWKGKSK